MHLLHQPSHHLHGLLPTEAQMLQVTAISRGCQPIALMQQRPCLELHHAGQTALILYSLDQVLPDVWGAAIAAAGCNKLLCRLQGVCLGSWQAADPVCIDRRGTPAGSMHKHSATQSGQGSRTAHKLLGTTGSSRHVWNRQTAGTCGGPIIEHMWKSKTLHKQTQVRI